MNKGSSLHQQFAERRAEFSTRISARGHGYEQTEYGEIHAPIAAQIGAAIVALRRAEAECRVRGDDADKQVNILRGSLGSMRRLLRDPGSFTLSALFMTSARALLPVEVFDVLLAQARWFREESARHLLEDIDAAIGPQLRTQASITMSTQKAARRRRSAYHQGKKG